MSALETRVSDQFIQAMGPMIHNDEAVHQVVAYIHLLSSPQMQKGNQATSPRPYTTEEVETRLAMAEDAFEAGEGIPEQKAREHRHAHVEKLLAV